MISYFMLGTNDFDKAVAFYDALMAEMGAQKVPGTDRFVGWGWGIGTPLFIVCKTHDGNKFNFIHYLPAAAG